MRTAYSTSRRFPIWLLVPLFVLSTASLGGPADDSSFVGPTPLPTPQSTGNPEVVSKLEAYAKSPAETIEGRTLHMAAWVARFYDERYAQPAWTDLDGTPNKPADDLVSTIRGIWKEGLAPSDYHIEAIDNLLAVNRRSPEQTLALETLLTDAFFFLGQHLYAGKVDPPELDMYWAIRRRNIDIIRELESALASANIPKSIRRLTQQNKRYRKLRAALAKFKELEKQGVFPSVDEGPALTKGMQGPRVVQLRGRLVREKFLDKSDELSETFDDTLETAVKAFQSSRGVDANGVVTGPTIAALNVPVAKLIRQIESNLERLRWLPRKLGKRYVFVDIAGFNLEGFENDRRALSMKIIVGEEFRRTPMLSTKATGVVLNPYWNIPRSIITDDIIPAARKNSAYLVNREIRVYEQSGGARREVDPTTIDWTTVRDDGAPYFFQEHSGPRNPLGSVKFVLTNNWSVYLHGTPDSRLFAKEQRTLSHGCIRLEDPVKLATFLLKGSSPAWTTKSLKNEIAEGLEVFLRLPQSAPVYLWYRTAWVDDKDRVQFRKDVYGWDEVLGAALEGKIAVVPRKVKPEPPRRKSLPREAARN